MFFISINATQQNTEYVSNKCLFRFQLLALLCLCNQKLFEVFSHSLLTEFCIFRKQLEPNSSVSNELPNKILNINNILLKNIKVDGPSTNMKKDNKNKQQTIKR